MTCSPAHINVLYKGLDVASNNIMKSKMYGTAETFNHYINVTDADNTGAIGVASNQVNLIDVIGEVESIDFNTYLFLMSKGFFVVTKTNDPEDQNYFYTKKGTFDWDKDGYLKNDSGYYLRAIQTDTDPKKDNSNLAKLDNGAKLVTINKNDFKFAAKESKEMNINVNLPLKNQNADGSKAEAISQYVNLYDTLGIDHKLQVSFDQVYDKNKELTNKWRVYFSPISDSNAIITSNEDVEMYNGTDPKNIKKQCFEVEFNEYGEMVKVSKPASDAEQAMIDADELAMEQALERIKNEKAQQQTLKTEWDKAVEDVTLKTEAVQKAQQSYDNSLVTQIDATNNYTAAVTAQNNTTTGVPKYRVDEFTKLYAKLTGLKAAETAQNPGSQLETDLGQSITDLEHVINTKFSINYPTDPAPDSATWLATDINFSVMDDYLTGAIQTAETAVNANLLSALNTCKTEIQGDYDSAKSLIDDVSAKNQLKIAADNDVAQKNTELQSANNDLTVTKAIAAQAETDYNNFVVDETLPTPQFDVNTLTIIDATNPEAITRNPFSIKIDWGNDRVGVSEISINLGEVLERNATKGLKMGLTSSLSGNITQDGYSTCEDPSINIADSGLVSATFTNGVIMNLCKIPVANFNSPNKLFMTEDQAYKQTIESGEVYLTDGKMMNKAVAKSTVNTINNIMETSSLSKVIGYLAKAYSKANETDDALLKSI